MGYAIVGIPLTVLCVRNIGSLLSVIVTGIYRHVFVGLVMRWRLAKARMRRSRRINLIKEVMNDGARRLSTQLSRHWLTIDRHLVRDQELRKSLRRLRKERKRWRLGRMGTRTHSSEDTEPFEEEDDEKEEEEEERQEDEDVEEKEEVEEDKSLGDIQSKITVSGTRTARVHWKEATKISGEGDIHQENKERIEQIKSDSKEEERKKRVKVSSDPTFTGNKADSHRKETSRCEFDPVAGEIQTVMTVQRSGCSDIGVCQETEMKEGGDKDVSCQQEETTLKRRSVRKGRVERTASNRSCDSTQSTRETEDNRKVKMRNSPTKRSVQRRKDKRLERARSVFLEEQEKLRRLLLEATRSSTHKPPAPRGRSHSFDATGSTNDNNDIDAVKDEAGGATRHRQEGSKVEGRRLKAGRPSSLHIRSQPTTPAARRQALDDTRGKQTSSSPLARSSSHRGGRPTSTTIDSDNLTSPRRSQMQGAGEVGAFRGSPARAAGESGGARDEEDEVVVEEDDEEDEDPLSKPPDTSSVRVPAWVTLLIMTAYILGGAVMFTMWEDDWDFLEGCYFCFITLSTIGFGDFVPGTSLDSWAAQEKWTMCCVYLLFGMAMQSMCFHLMQEEVRASVRSLAARCGLATKNDAMVEDVVDDFQNTETNTKTKEVVT